MPLINDDILFPLSSFISGCTVIGSLPNGQTVQFSYDAFATARINDTDVLHVANATKVGQTAFANTDSGNVDFPGINNGKKFIGVINTYPPTIEAHFDIIFKLL